MSIECRNCGCKMNRVANTYQWTVRWGGAYRTHVRRRRICRHCGLPFTTVEVLEDENTLGVPELPPKESDSPATTPIDEETPRNPYLPD